MATRLWPFADATARTAAGLPIASACPAVAARLSVGNLPQHVPHRSLEIRSRRLQRYIELTTTPGEVLIELGVTPVDQVVIPRHKLSVEATFQRCNLRLKHPSVGKLKEAYTLIRRPDDHRAKGRIDAAVSHHPAFRRKGRGRLHHRLKALAESAERFIPAGKGGIRDGDARGEGAVCLVHAHHTLIPVKGAAQIPAAPAAHLRR